MPVRRASYTCSQPTLQAAAERDRAAHGEQRQQLVLEAETRLTQVTSEAAACAQEAVARAAAAEAAMRADHERQRYAAAAAAADERMALQAAI